MPNEPLVRIFDELTGQVATVTARSELLVTRDTLATVLAYDASDNIEYAGWANIATATSAASWRVINLSYDGSNNLTAITWADGNNSFDNIWDNRAALSYS